MRASRPQPGRFVPPRRMQPLCVLLPWLLIGVGCSDRASQHLVLPAPPGPPERTTAPPPPDPAERAELPEGRAAPAPAQAPPARPHARERPPSEETGAPARDEAPTDNPLVAAMQELRRRPRQLPPRSRGSSRRCTRDKARALSELEYLGCDCRKAPPGIDHCYTPMGCGCYCLRLRALLRDCPHLYPKLEAQRPPGG